MDSTITISFSSYTVSILWNCEVIRTSVSLPKHHNIIHYQLLRAWACLFLCKLCFVMSRFKVQSYGAGKFSFYSHKLYSVVGRSIQLSTIITAYFSAGLNVSNSWQLTVTMQKASKRRFSKLSPSTMIGTLDSISFCKLEWYLATVSDHVIASGLTWLGVYQCTPPVTWIPHSFFQDFISLQ